MQNTNEIIIYSKNLATHLKEKGFKLIRSEINVKYPKYNVFIFQKDDTIEEVIKKYLDR